VPVSHWSGFQLSIPECVRKCLSHRHRLPFHERRPERPRAELERRGGKLGFDVEAGPISQYPVVSGKDGVRGAKQSRSLPRLPPGNRQLREARNDRADVVDLFIKRAPLAREGDRARGDSIALSRVRQ